MMHTGTPSLLIVDDEPLILRSYKRLFERSGVEVVTACSGRTALAMLRRKRFDLVLSDVSMCDGDGFVLLDELRGNPAAPRVVLMTGLADCDRDQVLQRGGAELLNKPISVATLDTLASTLTTAS